VFIGVLPSFREAIMVSSQCLFCSTETIKICRKKKRVFEPCAARLTCRAGLGRGGCKGKFVFALLDWLLVAARRSKAGVNRLKRKCTR